MTVGTISTEWDLFSRSLLFPSHFSFCWMSVFSFFTLYLCFRCVWSSFFSCHRFGSLDPRMRDLSPWTTSIVFLVNLNSAEGKKPEEWFHSCCAEISFSISCHLHSYIFLCCFQFSLSSHLIVSSFCVSLWIFSGPCHQVCFDYSCIQDAVSQLDFPVGVVSQTRRAQTAREVGRYAIRPPVWTAYHAFCVCGFLLDDISSDCFVQILLAPASGFDVVSQLDIPNGVVSQTRRTQTAREVSFMPPGPLFGLLNAHPVHAVSFWTYTPAHCESPGSRNLPWDLFFHQCYLRNGYWSCDSSCVHREPGVLCDKSTVDLQTAFYVFFYISNVLVCYRFFWTC